MTLKSLSGKKLIFLTTKGRRTGRPHCVELWFAVSDSKIFLSHEGQHTDWIKNIRKESIVSLRIGAVNYTGNARIVDEKGIFNSGKHALYSKYYGTASDDVIDDWFSESTVVEVSSIVREKRNQ